MFTRGSQTVLVLFDFSRAFNCVNHEILCVKFGRLFNFDSTSTSLIRNYLSNRFMVVSLNDVPSEPAEIIAGVPQGSVLDILLFSLLIKDARSVLMICNYHLFANDLQVYHTFSPQMVQQGICELNDDLLPMKVVSYQFCKWQGY